MAQTRTPHSHIKRQPVQEDPEQDQENLERWLVMYREMLRIRFFEEQVNDLYRTARMPGLAHLYSGEEAVAVGVCQALRRDDYITSTHRGHGHCLAKGASIDRMFAELLGKEPGYCRGKGGSMHIADQDTGNLGANAIVGGSAGIATGAAFSSKMRKQRSSGGLLLWRRRARPGCALRSHEHGFALEAAHHLCLREQSVQRVHALLRDDRRKHLWARRGFRLFPPKRSTARMSRLVYATARQAGGASTPGRGAGVPTGKHLSLLWAPRGRYSAHLLSLQRRRGTLEDRA